MFKVMNDINTHEIIEAFMSPRVSFLGKGYIGAFSTESVTTLTQFEADEQLVTGDMLPGVNYYNVEHDVFGAKLKQITISHPALIHGDFIIREELCSSGLSTTFYNDGRGYNLEEVYNDFRNLNEVYKNLTEPNKSRIDLFNATKAKFMNDLQAEKEKNATTNPDGYLGCGGEVNCFHTCAMAGDILTITSGNNDFIIDNDAEVIKPYNLTRGTKPSNIPVKIYDTKKELIGPSESFIMGVAEIGTAIKTIDETINKEFGITRSSNADNLSEYASNDTNSDDSNINKDD